MRLRTLLLTDRRRDAISIFLACLKSTDPPPPPRMLAGYCCELNFPPYWFWHS